MWFSKVRHMRHLCCFTFRVDLHFVNNNRKRLAIGLKHAKSFIVSPGKCYHVSGHNLERVIGRIVFFFFFILPTFFWFYRKAQTGGFNYLQNFGADSQK